MPPLTLRGVRTCKKSRILYYTSQIGASFPSSYTQRHFSLGQSFLEQNGPKEPPKVRWYEQLLGSMSKRTEIASAEEELETSELKERISQLEKELQELRVGGFLRSNELQSQLSKEDRAKLEEAMKLSEDLSLEVPNDAVDRVLQEQSRRGDGTLRPPNDISTIDPAVVVRVPLPTQYQPYLDRLNRSLQQAASNTSDPQLRRELWKWYSRCKQNLPPFLHQIPDKAWNVLWETQYQISASNSDRAAHLKVLSDDIISSGRELVGTQKLARIESMFLEGEHQMALSAWEAHKESLGSDESTMENFWCAGVRMYASEGNAQRAQEIAHNLLSSRGGKNARILIPLIAAWSKKGSETDLQNAWSLYITLRERLGPNINMTDYDIISKTFLSVGAKQLALAVFKDMMLTGQASAEDSAALYKQSLGLVGDLQACSVGALDTNKVSIEALTILPREFQNKFFYGSWIKKLLGEGEPDAAALVVELMYERGVRPDPKHLNGIIGAWLRVGTTQSREKAEGMGWAMIQERMDFAWRRRMKRRGDDTPAKPSVSTSDEGIRVPRYLQRVVPPATIETFSVLVLYYLRREKYAHVRHLQNLLRPAEIRPNAYFMNHLLYAELRSRGYQKAWDKFTQMADSVRPDMETFACLWDCMKVHVSSPKNNHQQGFPGPRSLYRDMSTWYSKMLPRDRKVAKEDFTKEMYDQIVRCFGLSDDMEGTLVAMHAMEESFSIYPDEGTARMVVLQVSRLGLAAVDPRRRRRSNTNSKENLGKANKVLEGLAQRRRKVLLERGIDLKKFDEIVKAHECLNLLSAFLRVVLAKTTDDVEKVDRDIERAAWDMGVSGINTGYPFNSISD
ncbi:MAG: hypothetical protein M1827_004290 [Pycnora praestabilis]|nr:MAG: hypothetical protein M1827_004290 [Pycnora praestabilis]